MYKKIIDLFFIIQTHKYTDDQKHRWIKLIKCHIKSKNKKYEKISFTNHIKCHYKFFL